MLVCFVFCGECDSGWNKREIQKNLTPISSYKYDIKSVGDVLILGRKRLKADPEITQKYDVA
jgi:hypothetical protein